MGNRSGSVGRVAFAWVAVGTLGLLLNEFVVDLGRIATLSSAAVDLVGLVALGYSLILEKRESRA